MNKSGCDELNKFQPKHRTHALVKAFSQKFLKMGIWNGKQVRNTGRERKEINREQLQLTVGNAIEMGLNEPTPPAEPARALQKTPKYVTDTQDTACSPQLHGILVAIKNRIKIKNSLLP